MADQFSIHFEGHFLSAHRSDRQSARLKIFQVGQSQVRTHDDVLHIPDDVEIAEVFEDKHIQFSIIDYRLLEYGQRRPVITPVPDKHERPFARAVFM